MTCFHPETPAIKTERQTTEGFFSVDRFSLDRELIFLKDNVEEDSESG